MLERNARIYRIESNSFRTYNNNRHTRHAPVGRISEEKTPPKIPNVAPPHFCAHISLSPSPPSSPEKHGESPDPPPMAGTLPAAARAHITRCSSGLNLLNRRVVAVTMLYVPPHRLRMPIALRLANFHDWGTWARCCQLLRRSADGLHAAPPRTVAAQHQVLRPHHTAPAPNCVLDCTQACFHRIA